MLTVVVPVALAILLVQAPSPTGKPPNRPIAAADSMRLLRRVSGAQHAFEAFRRNRLPAGSLPSGQCDARVGRYCHWRDDDDTDEHPPIEAPAIQARRDELLGTLDSASSLAPGDPWIAGQRVRYLVEAGRTDDAIQFAYGRCSAALGWCDALAGYAAQASGRFAVADSAYALALAAMVPAERCRWFDISDLLDGELARRFESLDCAGREAFARRLFWIGAPLYSVSETDLLTEYLARRTWTRIAERSAAPDGESWGDDIRALTLRYGWSRWYERFPPPVGSQRDASFAGHEAGPLLDFLPSVHSFDDLGHIGAEDWQFDDPQALTGYAPAYTRSLHDVDNQIALFRRGDSTLVVAAWDARQDTTLLGRPLSAALVLAADGTVRAVARRDSAGATGGLVTSGIIDSGLVSLELLAETDRRAARSRVGVPARIAAHVALSDLLLHVPIASASADLTAAVDCAFHSETIDSRGGLGVYWETYGLESRGEPVQYTLMVAPLADGWFHRAAERLHLADPSRELRIEWQEVPQPVRGIAARDVRLDLSTLRSGRYRIQLTAAPLGEAPVVAAREIRLP